MEDAVRSLALVFATALVTFFVTNLWARAERDEKYATLIWARAKSDLIASVGLL
jgi:hypothetical protein